MEPRRISMSLKLISSKSMLKIYTRSHVSEQVANTLSEALRLTATKPSWAKLKKGTACPTVSDKAV